MLSKLGSRHLRGALKETWCCWCLRDSGDDWWFSYRAYRTPWRVLCNLPWTHNICYADFSYPNSLSTSMVCRSIPKVRQVLTEEKYHAFLLQDVIERSYGWKLGEERSDANCRIDRSRSSWAKRLDKTTWSLFLCSTTSKYCYTQLV